ncbi:MULTISPECIES: hypothetical protein [Butyricimonas]|uniref:hypothetical protein n=1 Tax=Butyricimonas TaxID=574697 RepID=UPI0007FB24FB|nr:MULTISPECIES: hypothetical protein [Butyricimonas]
MKKFVLFAFMAILFCSCGSMRYSESTYVFDYTDHEDKDFIISPTTTGFDHEALAKIHIVFHVGNAYKNMDAKDLVQKKNVHGKTKCYPTSRRILNQCIKEAKKFGADALIGFTVTEEINTKYGTKTGRMDAEGIAVKVRK